MKKLVLLLMILIFLNGYFAGATVQIHKHNQFLDEIEPRIDALGEYNENLKGQVEHYKFQAEAQEYYNQLLEEENAALIEACENLTEERDILYKALDDCLNPPYH